MRIAVVGAGVSGLTAAHLLHGAHDVRVFEADTRIGGHAHTVEVDVGGERVAVDTGFIVYNQRTYPRFTRLLATLGVETRQSDMSFSVACERTGRAWASLSLDAVFSQRRNLVRPSFWRMLRDIARFNGESRALVEAGEEKLTLRDYLAGGGYSREFVDHYAVPMGAAIWSAAPEAFLDFPAASFVRFFHNHGLLDRRRRLPWRVVAGGSRRYVDALAAPFRGRIRTGCAVRGVCADGRGVALATADGALHRFDRVVLAVHSDQALAMLRDASDAERQVLGSIRTQENRAVLHDDPSVMPRPRRAWASWNYRIPRTPQQRVFVSYHMNRLQELTCRRDLFVTLNGGDRIAPDRVLASVGYHHPVFDAKAVAAQKAHAAIDGRRGVHFCGAWWGHGFHEDGVASADAVCRKLGRSLQA